MIFYKMLTNVIKLAEYNKHHDSKQQNFSIGGQMLKKMVESYEKKSK